MAKKQLIRKITWIKDRDINGNYGYRNTKTGEFRTTLPNSKEQNKQNQTRLNKAILRAHSHKLQNYENNDANRRNHSDEVIKKTVNVPYLMADKQGNFQEGTVKTLAPGEDSSKINSTLEGLFIGDKVFRLGSGLTKIALAKTGNNYLSHWARNSLLNEAAKGLTKNFSSSAIFNGENLVPKEASLGDNSIQSMSYYKPMRRAWTNGNGEGNAATSYFFKQQPDQRFELVKDIEPNNYSVHFKTDQGALNYGQKMQLFAKVADEIPKGSNVSTWGSVSKGGIHGVNRFGKDFGFNQIGTRQLTMKGTGKPINIGIFKKASIGTPGYPYFYNPVTKQWDFSTANQLLKQGKQEFIDWMNNSMYRKAAQANKEEAQSMGLSYTPTYEKAEYLLPQKTTLKDIGSSGLGGTTDLNRDITVNIRSTQNPKDVMQHEFGHANYHGNVSPTTMANMTQGKKEWDYLKFKASQIFKPDSEYGGQYDLHTHAPEAAMNARDYGKELGLQVGQEYPGYEQALQLINTNKNGFKSGLLNMFYLDKEHMPYVWKALTGTQFAAPVVGVSLLNNNK